MPKIERVAPTVRFLPRLLITAGAFFAATTAWSADSPGRCAALKAKGAGIGLAASLSCHAAAARKGAAASPSCLARARGKLQGLFVRADTKGACGVSGDATTIGDSVESFAAQIAPGLLPAGAPETARRCAARKMIRAGAYGRERLACWGRAFRASATVDGQCFDAAGSRLVVGFTAAERKPCATTGDALAVEDALDAFLDAVASSVAPPPVSTTTTIPGTIPVSFSADVQPILTANCALAGCHAAPAPQEGLDLRPGRSYARLVNVDSRGCPRFKRVLPGRPDASYLLFKLAGPPQECFSGDRMPDLAPPLPARDQDTIRAWIAQGAPDN